jgi:general secretion pathway protein I
VRNKGRNRGYTLIEVLVAFMILAMTLTVLLRIFSGGLRSIAVSADYAQAVLIAETQLASAGIGEPLAAGERSGDENGKFHWTRTIRDYAPFANATGPTPVQAYHVAVAVEWPHANGTRRVDLATVQLAAPKRGQR